MLCAGRSSSSLCLPCCFHGLWRPASSSWSLQRSLSAPRLRITWWGRSEADFFCVKATGAAARGWMKGCAHKGPWNLLARRSLFFPVTCGLDALLVAGQSPSSRARPVIAPGISASDGSDAIAGCPQSAMSARLDRMASRARRRPARPILVRHRSAPCRATPALRDLRRCGVDAFGDCGLHLQRFIARRGEAEGRACACREFPPNALSSISNDP
jgi:hypothetical protein